MKVKTWIKYEDRYLPARCRKPRYLQCESYVNITLAEASIDELQLAFRDNSYGGAGDIYYFPVRKSLWKKAMMNDVCAGGEEEYGYHTPLEALIWWREHGSAYFLSEFDREYHGRDTSRKAVIKKAQTDMRHYLLVDGELYRQVSEPRYCIYTFGLGHNHGGTALSVDYQYNPNISKQRYFSALQGAEAVAEAKKIALGRGDTESIHRFKADIEVFMPELVEVNPQKQRGDGNP